MVALAVAAALSVRAQEGLARRSRHPTMGRREGAKVPLADLHADSLLWGRDLVPRSEAGQVDLPRLAQANAALQVFSVVTRIPEPFRMRGNSARSDGLWPLGVLESWLVGAVLSLEGSYQRRLWNPTAR